MKKVIIATLLLNLLVGCGTVTRTAPVLNSDNSNNTVLKSQGIFSNLKVKSLLKKAENEPSSDKALGYLREAFESCGDPDLALNIAEKSHDLGDNQLAYGTLKKGLKLAASLGPSKEMTVFLLMNQYSSVAKGWGFQDISQAADEFARILSR